MELSKSEFDRIRFENRLYISRDSNKHKKLTLREYHGIISNKGTLHKALEKGIDRTIDSIKPIVIMYHPGEDLCNSSAFKNYKTNLYDKKWIVDWFKQLEDGLFQLNQIQPIYIYKDKKGLEKYNGILNWHKDPEGIIEKLFFKHHYPCWSFVVISKSGKYISYFGESGKEQMWKATQLMIE